MLEFAIVYTAIAFLACWDVDLIITIARGPIMLDPAIKFVIVTICLAAIIFSLGRTRWLFVRG